MTAKGFTIGLDFGTNSVRALLVEVATGREIASSVWTYAHGSKGVLLDRGNPDLARQHPGDYLTGMEVTVRDVLKKAGTAIGLDAEQVIGIGVDTTGSSPLPLDSRGVALGLREEFQAEPDAMVWLWKDHTSHAQAERITDSARKHHPEYLSKCGDRYSSEWYWAKLLKLAETNDAVAREIGDWVEIADWIPAVLCATTAPGALKRGVCAAGHKAFYCEEWNGYPSVDWLGSLHPKLAEIGRRLPSGVHSSAERAGLLCPEWADRLGLRPGIAVAIGAFDAHLGAVGAGAKEGTLVKVIGTSTCDIMISRLADDSPDIPGLCGIVPGSVVPGYLGLEAGQSAVGDIYNWLVELVRPGSDPGVGHAELTAGASKLRPGGSGLLALDWHNGNRTILVDQRLTGSILGLTLHTSAAELYRAMLEASAFGARVIVERLNAYGARVRAVTNCGGISARNPLAMQIYADVLNLPITVSSTLETCALGSAIAAAVAAGRQEGGYADFDHAIRHMADKGGTTFYPIAENVPVYEQLFGLYRRLHDSFGVAGTRDDLSDVMKRLLAIRDGLTH